MPRSLGALAALLVLSVTLLSGCTPPPSYGAALADGAELGDTQPWPDSVRGAMPGVGYRDPYGGAAPVDVADAVIVGTFTGWRSAEPRRPVHWSGDADEWDVYSRGAVLDLAVDEVVSTGPDVTVGDTARVLLADGFFEDRDLADVADELVAVDRVAVFLNRPLFTERTGWVVSLDWSLLGEVAGDGTVTWPVLTAARAAEEERRDGEALPPQRQGRTPGSLPVDVATLAELRAEAE
ncbi:hypothetical protein [Isoptericola sp. AK164]|uniref:hypothetical protein n=1 Tax=Isoptericola sp. AK164 TaxID=3024246 RepID=UPI0024181871|nr:hypothetical protein [Isoptericola sp. AK164]